MIPREAAEANRGCGRFCCINPSSCDIWSAQRTTLRRVCRAPVEVGKLRVVGRLEGLLPHRQLQRTAATHLGVDHELVALGAMERCGTGQSRGAVRLPEVECGPPTALLCETRGALKGGHSSIDVDALDA